MELVGLMLVSHGKFAKEALKSAELIVGKQVNVQTMAVDLVDDIEGLVSEMNDKISLLDDSKGTIVICDLLGGTPMNLALANIKENMLVVSGLSLPVLLEVLMNRDKTLDELKQVVTYAHENSLHIKDIIDVQGS